MQQRYDGTAYTPVQQPLTEAERGTGAHLRLVDEPTGHPADGDLQWMELGPIDLELGGYLPNVTVAYRTWGALNAAGDNAVLALHALTGDSAVGGEQGWWGPLVGPGRAIDTDRAYVICANVLGGCQGTTGPASIDPLTGRAWGMRFPLITIGDMVEVERRLCERLGVTGLVAIGGSIGGAQALEWATRHPGLVRATVAIGATPALGPQAIALNEAGRRALMADPDWRGGEYAAEGVFPAEGLAIARMIAMVTFHSRQSMEERFGRKPAVRPSLYPSFGGTFDVEGYIHYHGASLVRRFDANAHLYLTRAMDLSDLYRDGGKERWLPQVAAPVLLVGINSDWLYPADEIVELAADLQAAGKDARYLEIDSPFGHDAFLKEWDQLAAIIAPFLDEALPEVGT